MRFETSREYINDEGRYVEYSRVIYNNGESEAIGQRYSSDSIDKDLHNSICEEYRQKSVFAEMGKKTMTEITEQNLRESIENIKNAFDENFPEPQIVISKSQFERIYFQIEHLEERLKEKDRDIDRLREDYKYEIDRNERILEQEPTWFGMFVFAVIIGAIIGAGVSYIYGG